LRKERAIADELADERPMRGDREIATAGRVARVKICGITLLVVTAASKGIIAQITVGFPFGQRLDEGPRRIGEVGRIRGRLARGVDAERRLDVDIAGGRESKTSRPRADDAWEGYPF
jgi:hypothetical protein